MYIHEKKHIWWGQTSYIAIPGQRCFELISSHQQYKYLVINTLQFTQLYNLLDSCFIAHSISGYAILDTLLF